MNTPIIREAHLGDVSALFDLFSATDRLHRDAHPEIFCEIGRPETIQEYYKACILDNDAVIYIAIFEQVLAGAIICTLKTTSDTPILVPRTYGCIENITVLPQYRRLGIGEGLMECAHQWARDTGASMIELTVWEFNQEAVNFYNYLGYSTIYRRMVKDL